MSSVCTLEKETIAYSLYCRHPNFGRFEQEHKHMGNENKSAKYGLTAFTHQIKLHLRPGAWKNLTDNHTVRDLVKARVPRLPCCERFGPSLSCKDVKVVEG